MVHRPIASQIYVAGGPPCSNVSVNDGEDVVKDRGVLRGAWSNARSKGLGPRA